MSRSFLDAFRKVKDKDDVKQNSINLLEVRRRELHQQVRAAAEPKLITIGEEVKRTLKAAGVPLDEHANINGKKRRYWLLKPDPYGIILTPKGRLAPVGHPAKDQGVEHFLSRVLPLNLWEETEEFQQFCQHDKIRVDDGELYIFNPGRHPEPIKLDFYDRVANWTATVIKNHQLDQSIKSLKPRR